METLFRAALLQWLRGDPVLSAQINLVEEESPLAATPPWLGIAASASADWSTKDRKGREVRLALELVTRGDLPGGDAALVSAVEARIETMPRSQPGFDLANTHFLRSRAERRPRGQRAHLIEYRFRLLEPQPE